MRAIRFRLHGYYIPCSACKIHAMHYMTKRMLTCMLHVVQYTSVDAAAQVQCDPRVCVGSSNFACALGAERRRTQLKRAADGASGVTRAKVIRSGGRPPVIPSSPSAPSAADASPPSVAVGVRCMCVCDGCGECVPLGGARKVGADSLCRECVGERARSCAECNRFRVGQRVRLVRGSVPGAVCGEVLQVVSDTPSRLVVSDAHGMHMRVPPQALVRVVDAVLVKGGGRKRPRVVGGLEPEGEVVYTPPGVRTRCDTEVSGGAVTSP